MISWKRCAWPIASRSCARAASCRSARRPSSCSGRPTTTSRNLRATFRAPRSSPRARSPSRPPMVSIRAGAVPAATTIEALLPHLAGRAVAASGAWHRWQVLGQVTAARVLSALASLGRAAVTALDVEASIQRHVRIGALTSGCSGGLAAALAVLVIFARESANLRICGRRAGTRDPVGAVALGRHDLVHRSFPLEFFRSYDLAAGLAARLGREALSVAAVAVDDPICAHSWAIVAGGWRLAAFCGRPALHGRRRLLGGDCLNAGACRRGRADLGRRRVVRSACSATDRRHGARV